MKKFIISLIMGTVMFSGCSFGGGENTPSKSHTQKPTLSDKKAKEQATKSPEDLFYTLAQANLDYSVDVMKKNIPSKEELEKGEKVFSISGDVSLDGTPAQSGKVHFDISTDSKSDFSDTENTKSVQEISFNGEITDSVVSGNANGKLELKVVDNFIFASLKELEISSPFVPKKKVDLIVGSLIGKWFGNSFDELNALQGKSQNVLNLKKFIAGTPFGVLFWDIIEDEQANLKDYITFVSLKEEKNGVYYFEAKYNIEKSKENIAKVGESFGLPEKIKKDMQRSIESMQKSQLLVIGYKASDSSYISIESPAINPINKEKIEGKTNTLTFSENEIDVRYFINKDDKFFFTAKDGKFNLSFNGKQNNPEDLEIVDIITGTYSDNSFAFDFYNAEDEKENHFVIASGRFTKTGDIWSGEITSPQNKDVVVKISNAMYSKSEAKVSITLEKTPQVEDGAKPKTFVYGPVNLRATIKPIDLVDVSSPESFESFENIQKYILPQQQISQEEEVSVEDSEISVNEGNINVKTQDGEISVTDGAINVNSEDMKIEVN